MRSMTFDIDPEVDDRALTPLSTRFTSAIEMTIHWKHGKSNLSNFVHRKRHPIQLYVRH